MKLSSECCCHSCVSRRDILCKCGAGGKEEERSKTIKLPSLAVLSQEINAYLIRCDESYQGDVCSSLEQIEMVDLEPLLF